MQILVEELELRVGQRILTRELTFSVNPGQMAAIRGPSGSGKSTLLSVISGYGSPYAGSIRFLDNGVDTTPTIDWLIQTTPLFLKRSVLDNAIAGALVRSGVVDRERAIATLENLGIAHLVNTPTLRLSGGERQRLALARVLLSDGNVILADEPTASLDPRTRDLVVRGIRELIGDSRVCLLATHDEAVADACDIQILLAQPVAPTVVQIMRDES